MTVENSEALTRLFTDDKVAARFGRTLISRYLTPAFGVLPKSETELLIFELLVDSGAIDPNGSIYNIARLLNITPTKAKSLIFQYQLRHVSAEQTDYAVFETLRYAKYFKDGTSLAFGVESPLVRAAISAKMRERGVFADVSLSGDILKVSPEQFGDILAELLPQKATAALVKALGKKGVNESEIRKAMKTVGKKTAEDFIVDQGKAGLGELLKQAGAAAHEHAPHALDHLLELLSAALA